MTTIGGLCADGDSLPLYRGPPLIKHRNRAVKAAVGRHFVVLQDQKLAKARGCAPSSAVEERRLRPPDAPQPPSRLCRHIGEELFPAVPGRQRGHQLRPKPREIRGVLAENDRPPRGQPVAQSIPTRGGLARGRPWPGAFQRIAAVGGDLGRGGHGSSIPSWGLHPSSEG